MKRFEIFLLSVLTLSTAAARNRSAEKDSLSTGLGANRSEFASGLGTAVISPRLRLHWISTGLAVLAALPLDDDVQAVRNDLMSNRLASFGDAWGDPIAALTILPGIYLAEALRGSSRPETRRRMKFTLFSLSTVATTTHLLKYATGRERPNGTSRLSFPSGHTSITFGVAEVVRTLYGNRAGAVLYSMALVTGISRIHDNKHYLSDVAAGAGLGIGLVRGFRLAQRPGAGIATVRIAALPGRMMLEIRL